MTTSGNDLSLDLTAKVLARHGCEGRNVVVERAGLSYSSYLWDLAREEGRDWPVDAETKIGMKRLANIRHCVENVLTDGVPGGLVETGSWRAGATIYTRPILKAHGVSDRTGWVADSFAGLPRRAGRYAADRNHVRAELASGVEEVRDNVRRYDLLDNLGEVPRRLILRDTPLRAGRATGRAASRRGHGRLHHGRARHARLESETAQIRASASTLQPGRAR